ncbi:unnamed protein product [Adineta steineri]|uniref:Uncharacterized protein n=1 Tax=Adineta steineri TaxID=433720 RepID=A0A815I4L9_9BILA|nr:unnamed protein product [Adineta steineri]
MYATPWYCDNYRRVNGITRYQCQHCRGIIPNDSQQEEMLTTEPEISSGQNKKRKLIRILIILITSIMLMLGIAIPLSLTGKKKVDSSTTILSPLKTTTMSITTSTIKMKVTRTTRRKTTTLRTTRTGTRKKPPNTARPANPEDCTIS